MSRKLLVLLLPILALSACSGPVEDTRPGQPVKQRQEAFKAMLRAFEPMGVMLRTKKYEAESFAALAEQLHQLKDKPWPHFAPDTHYPPTKARTSVWSDAAGFEKERQTYVAGIEALREAANTRDLALIQPAYEKVYASCKSCHKAYKD